MLFLILGRLGDGGGESGRVLGREPLQGRRCGDHHTGGSLEGAAPVGHSGTGQRKFWRLGYAGTQKGITLKLFEGAS